MTEFEARFTAALEHVADALTPRPYVDHSPVIHDGFQAIAAALKAGLDNIAHAIRQTSGNAR